MKKLSKLFLATILVCSLSLSVACGKVSADDIKADLVGKGFSVTMTKNASLYASAEVLGGKAQKGDFYELIATKQDYSLSETQYFKCIENGNYVEAVGGAYIYDATALKFREVQSGETGTHNRVQGRYVPDKLGGFIYDATQNKFVEDEDVNYFLKAEGDYYFDASTSTYFTNDVDMYVEDKGGRFTVDAAGKFIYDEANSKFLEIDGKRYKLDGEAYVQANDGTFFKSKYGTVYSETAYTEEKKGLYVFDTATNGYVLDEDYNYAFIESGIYVADKEGDYKFDRTANAYVLDTDVNYAKKTIDVYVLSKNGNYVKDGESYKSDSAERFYKDGEEYKRLTTSKDKFYRDANGNYVKDKDLGDYVKNGDTYTQLVVYVKDGASNYVVDTAERYAKVDNYAPYTSADKTQKYKFNTTTGKYVADNDENFSFDPNLFVPATKVDDGDYVYNADNGFVVDTETYYSQVSEDEYVVDPEGTYVLEERYIVIIVFEKTKDARKTFKAMRESMYKTGYYYGLFRGKATKGYVSGRNGNVIYLGHTDDLADIDELRLK